MAGKITKKIKVQMPGGKATPAPPVGPVLGQAGINIGEFISKFNEQTRSMMGDIIPVEITVYENRSYDFVLKTPPASQLLFKAAKTEKGSGTNLTKKAGKVTRAQLREIAEKKMSDLNTTDIEAAMSMVAGTARSSGVEVVG